MIKRVLFIAALMTFIEPAMAQKAVLTGGERGAYHETFCPPIPAPLGDLMFPGYRCTASGGTLDNIKQVVAQPTNVGVRPVGRSGARDVGKA